VLLYDQFVKPHVSLTTRSIRERRANIIAIGCVWLRGAGSGGDVYVRAGVVVYIRGCQRTELVLCSMLWKAYID